MGFGPRGMRGGPFGDELFVVEQVVYVDPGPSRRVLSMSMLCSGFVRERGVSDVLPPMPDPTADLGCMGN